MRLSVLAHPIASICTMENSIFNPDHQHQDLSGKVTAGLVRISTGLRSLLWNHAKVAGLSPIQIQILIFVAYHDAQLCSNGSLAQEFNLTKPTISDAVKVLEKKGLIEKVISPKDKRAYTIALTEKGKQAVDNTETYANPLQQQLEGLEEEQLDQLWASMSHLINKLHQNKVLEVQRTCFSCKHCQEEWGSHVCTKLEIDLGVKAVRLDCAEFESSEK